MYRTYTNTCTEESSHSTFYSWLNALADKHKQNAIVFQISTVFDSTLMIGELCIYTKSYVFIQIHVYVYLQIHAHMHRTYKNTCTKESSHSTFYS